LNNGDGTFRAGPTLTLTGAANSVVVGDFNGDGKQDIAVATGSQIEVFLGTGHGTFLAPRIFSLSNSSDTIQALVAGDFNRDGRLDLAATVLLPDSSETSEVVVLLGNGNGTFRQVQAVKVGSDALGLATADLNGDGRLDLVTTSFLPDGTRDVKVLLGNGNGTFKSPIATTPGGSATAVAAGDFNGDGKQDLVLTDNRDNTVTVLLGNGNGTFKAPHTFQFDNPVKEIGDPAVGDFFGDGKLSVAVGTGLGDVSVLRGNGDGTFQAPLNFVGDFHGQQPTAVVAADFNGDGKLDLASTNVLSNDVSVLLNTTPKPVAAAPVATSTSLAADVNAAVFGQPVTLTATVTAASGIAVGTVTFLDGSTMLGAVALDPNGQARLVVQLGVGAHSLTASFAGLAPFAASNSAALSETINKAATTTALTVQTHAFGVSTAVILTATVAPVAPGAGTPTGTVTFVEGNKILGTATLDANGQASLFLLSLPLGQHTITAIYGGDGDFTGSASDLVTFLL
jgi:hypothetical protein